MTSYPDGTEFGNGRSFEQESTFGKGCKFGEGSTFGDGCELANGAFVTGSIDLEYGPLVAGQRNITYNYVDYTYNGNSVTGGGTILRKVANGNGNPESTVNESIEVSFPDTPVTATRTGQRIAEWVDGVGSGIWADNVYFIDVV